MPVNGSDLHLRESVQRKIPGTIRVIEALLYVSVVIFAVMGSMGGFLWLVPALGTLFGSWYFMGLARVTYEYRLDGPRLEVKRLSGMRSRPKTEDFLTLELGQLVVAANEGAEQLAAAERASQGAAPKRITYDVSAHDPARGCGVAYAMGVGPESGRWLKVYFQPTRELCACLRLLCPGRVFIHADQE